MTSHPAPKIYVASLTDYNAGCLYGRWIDANQDPEEIAAEVQEMLAGSPEPGAEEWAIHDDQGFPEAVQLSEWESFERVSAIAKAIDTHGPEVVGAYVSHVGMHYINPDTLEDDVAESYQGHWPSLGDYAEQLAEDLGMPGSAFESWPYRCIDWENAGEELRLGGDIWAVDGWAADSWGVYVFNRV